MTRKRACDRNSDGARKGKRDCVQGNSSFSKASGCPRLIQNLATRVAITYGLIQCGGAGCGWANSLAFSMRCLRASKVSRTVPDVLECLPSSYSHEGALSVAGETSKHSHRLSDLERERAVKHVVEFAWQN